MINSGSTFTFWQDSVAALSRTLRLSKLLPLLLSLAFFCKISLETKTSPVIRNLLCGDGCLKLSFNKNIFHVREAHRNSGQPTSRVCLNGWLKKMKREIVKKNATKGRKL